MINIASITGMPKGVFTWHRGQLSRWSEFTPVPPHGSAFVYMIPPENVMPAWVTQVRVHSGCCTGVRNWLRVEISQQHHVNAKRPHISVWNQSVGRLEQVAHALCMRFWITHVFYQHDVYLQIVRYEMSQSSCKHDTKQKVIPVWNSRQCEFSHVNTPWELVSTFKIAKSTVEPLHNSHIGDRRKRP